MEIFTETKKEKRKKKVRNLKKMRSCTVSYVENWRIIKIRISFWIYSYDWVGRLIFSLVCYSVNIRNLNNHCKFTFHRRHSRQLSIATSSSALRFAHPARSAKRLPTVLLLKVAADVNFSQREKYSAPSLVSSILKPNMRAGRHVISITE